MLIDRETVTANPFSGLTVVHPSLPYLQPFSVDMFIGQLPRGPKSSFFVHSTENRHLIEAHPISRKIVETNRKTAALHQRKNLPSYREQFVAGKNPIFPYLPLVKKLTEAAGTAVVNAHVVTSASTQVTSCGVHQAILYFPESFTDRAHIRDIQAIIAKLAEDVREFGQPGDDWFYGLGALTGIRPYTNYFTEQNAFPFTNGNALTGCMVADGILELTKGYAEHRGRFPSIGIVGATGSTGMVTVANVADWYHGHLTIAAHNHTELEFIKDQLPKTIRRILIQAGEDAALNTAKTCDIVVYLVADPSLRVDPQAYKPGAIVYDPSRPRLHTSSDFANRPDIRLLDGPSVLIPGQVLRPGLNNYDSNEMLSCMAQTAYCAVSGDRKFLMPPLRVNKFDYDELRHKSIRLMAETRDHGFHIAPWHRWLDRKYTTEELFQ